MKTKIAVFYGGKITKHLVMIREAARKLRVDLKLISYNLVSFGTETGKVNLRGEDLNQFDVVFFRTTGKHWEEVDLIVESLKVESQKAGRIPMIVDPMVEHGKASQACKAWQMVKLREAGIPVPKTIYGSLWYLYDLMARQQFFVDAHTNARRVTAALQKKPIDSPFEFPVILKGSGGDRGTRVFKAENLEELERLVRDLRKSETEEGKRYMLQEYIENQGDYRVLVLGEKVLGVMRRYRKDEKDFRNNYSTGGGVEVGDLPPETKKMAVEAAKVCGLMVAGVDVMPQGDGYVVLEVNKGPQFWGFMKATGIDVPMEIVKYLVSLKNDHL